MTLVRSNFHSLNVSVLEIYIMSEKAFVHKLKFPLDQSDYAVNLIDNVVNVFIKPKVCLKQYP